MSVRLGWRRPKNEGMAQLRWLTEHGSDECTARGASCGPYAGGDATADHQHPREERHRPLGRDLQALRNRGFDREQAPQLCRGSVPDQAVVAERCEQRCREKTALWSRFDETAAAALHRLHTGGVTLAVVSNCVGQGWFRRRAAVRHGDDRRADPLGAPPRDRHVEHRSAPADPDSSSIAGRRASGFLQVS